MDYKAMWEELKAKVKSDLEYYEDGLFCSWGEAVHGAENCKDMLNKMNALEDKYNN